MFTKVTLKGFRGFEQLAVSDLGLFSLHTWQTILTEVGYVVERFVRPLDDEGEFDG